MTKIIPLVLAVAFALTGCTATHQRSVAHPALMTDDDRYAAAIESALQAYGHEIDTADRFEYPTEESSERMASIVAPSRFDQHLETALSHRGLSHQGLELHCTRHPEFLRSQRQQVGPRLEALHVAALRIAGPSDDVSWASILLDAEPPALAAR